MSQQRNSTKAWDQARAQKRGGGVAPLPLDFASGESRLTAEPADNRTPERLYEQQWVLSLLEHVLARLRDEGFSDEVVTSVDALTKRHDESDYFAFVQRAMRNTIGRKVKLADLEDNSDLSRIPSPTAADLARVARYHRAIAEILDYESSLLSRGHRG